MFKWIKKCWKSLIIQPDDYDVILIKAVGQHCDLCTKYGHESKEALQFVEDHKNIPDFKLFSDATIRLRKLYSKITAIE